MFPLFPHRFSAARLAVQRTRGDEQEIGQPVQVLQQVRCILFSAKGDQRALGAAACGAREVGRGGGARAAGQMKSSSAGSALERRARARGPRVAFDDEVCPARKLAAEIEEIVLHGVSGAQGRRQGLGEHMPIALLSSSTSPIAATRSSILADARAVGEPGRPVVAGARVDSGEALGHNVLVFSNSRDIAWRLAPFSSLPARPRAPWQLARFAVRQGRLALAEDLLGSPGRSPSRARDR